MITLQPLPPIGKIHDVPDGPDCMNALFDAVWSAQQNGVSEGNRNRRLFAAARALNDNHIPKSVAQNKLLTRALADGLTESEARNAIASGYNYTPSKPEISDQLYKRLVAAQALRRGDRMGCGEK